MQRAKECRRKKWERAVTAGSAGDVIARMSQRKRTQIQRKPSLSETFTWWDDLLNSDTVLSVTISRGILPKKHSFGIKDWNKREKDTSSGV